MRCSNINWPVILERPGAVCEPHLLTVIQMCSTLCCLAGGSEKHICHHHSVACSNPNHKLGSARPIFFVSVVLFRCAWKCSSQSARADRRIRQALENYLILLMHADFSCNGVTPLTSLVQFFAQINELAFGYSALQPYVVCTYFGIQVGEDTWSC